MPGHISLALPTCVPVLIPSAFASYLAAIQQVVSAFVGTTASGRPRYSGCSCCSTDAKKLFRSMWREPNRAAGRVLDAGLSEFYSLCICPESRRKGCRMDLESRANSYLPEESHSR